MERDGPEPAPPPFEAPLPPPQPDNTKARRVVLAIVVAWIAEYRRVSRLFNWPSAAYTFSCLLKTTAGRVRYESKGPSFDQPAAHPSQRGANDRAPTVMLDPPIRPRVWAAPPVLMIGPHLLLFVDKRTLVSWLTWVPPRFGNDPSIATQFEEALNENFAIALRQGVNLASPSQPY